MIRYLRQYLMNISVFAQNCIKVFIPMFLQLHRYLLLNIYKNHQLLVQIGWTCCPKLLHPEWSCLNYIWALKLYHQEHFTHANLVLFPIGFVLWAVLLMNRHSLMLLDSIHSSHNRRCCLLLQYHLKLRCIYKLACITQVHPVRQAANS